MWCFNVQYLKELSFCESIKELIRVGMQCPLFNTDKRVWWDNLKYDLKLFCISYGIERQRVNFSRERELREALTHEFNKAAESGEGNSNRILEIQELLRDFEQEKCMGAIVRSRARYVVEGEQSTKFFFGLESFTQRSSYIGELLTSTGERISDTVKILDEVCTFYKSLFQSQGTVRTERETLLSYIDKTVSDSDKVKCDSKVTLSEIEEALAGMKTNKSLGSDGFPIEFYRAFKEMLGPILVKVYKEIQEDGLLSPTMRRSIITLIYKKQGDPALLKNYRPLSLLNCDYKILTRVFANRLKGVMPTIISHSDILCSM